MGRPLLSGVFLALVASPLACASVAGIGDFTTTDGGTLQHDGGGPPDPALPEGSVGPDSPHVSSLDAGMTAIPDSSRVDTSIAESGGCVPLTEPTCLAKGACGNVDDECGGVLDCGACPAGSTCGPINICVADTSDSGHAGEGGTDACVATTCIALGLDCGSAPDGCGTELQCGSCPGTETCGGGGTPGICGPPPCTGYNVVAGDVGTCMTTLADCDLVGTCSVGGGCCLDGNPPGTGGCVSANPGEWGACIPASMCPKCN